MLNRPPPPARARACACTDEACRAPHNLDSPAAAAAAPDLASLERQLTSLTASTSTSNYHATHASPNPPAAAVSQDAGTLYAPAPQAFSSHALKELSLALGAQGLALQVRRGGGTARHSMAGTYGRGNKKALHALLGAIPSWMTTT